MDNVELSPATRWGMIATGLLQGLVCYLLIVWLSGKNHSWIVYGVPATVAFSSVLLFSVISFKQKRLWGWLALVFIATLGMSGWCFYCGASCLNLLASRFSKRSFLQPTGLFISR